MESFLIRVYTKGAEVHRPVHVASTLASAMEYLAQAVDGPFPTRVLLVETRDAEVTVFNNAWRSRGWYEMGFLLTKMFRAEDVYFLCQPNTIGKTGGKLHGQYGGVQLIRLERGAVVRSISLVNDGGRWVFTTQGEPAPFEKLEQYQAPRKSDRFSPALLEEYLGAMNLFPFSDEFYVVDRTHPAVGIEITMSGSERPNEFRPISLQAIKEAYGPFE
jgi:hypothetical protein